eukprot:scaffold123480_cov45-Phaeocystis_antarctica.AAC.3
MPTDWPDRLIGPRLAGAWGRLRHGLALREASGEPAGRGLSHLVSHPRFLSCPNLNPHPNPNPNPNPNQVPLVPDLAQRFPARVPGRALRTRRADDRAHLGGPAHLTLTLTSPSP